MKRRSVFHSKKDDTLYFVLSTDTDIRLLLEEITEQHKTKLPDKRDAVEKCIRAVLFFENNKSITYDKIPEDEEICSHTLEPVDLGECGIKFKCIVAMKEYLDGDYKSISEAAYTTCIDEYVNLVATAIDKGEGVKEKTRNIIVLTSMILAFTGSFTGIFIVPMELLASLGMLSEKRVSSILGTISSKYSLYKIKKLKKSEKKDYYSNYPDTDFSQEYFDPTYVNM